jgi:Fe-S-cluster containining protein
VPPIEPACPSDCRLCGVCCFSTLDRYLRVSGDDYERLGDRADALVQFIENRAYMRMRDGHCAALLLHEAGGFSCSVYDRRPDNCRDLQRGSPQCAGELATKAHRPPRR